MTDIMIHGEIGKLHAIYHRSDKDLPPIAVVLSGNPQKKHHMNDRVSYATFKAFADADFSVVRFNYRGVEDSEGEFGSPDENVLDTALVLDWIQDLNEGSYSIWLAGYDIGAWYILKSLMRRPEITGFVLTSPDPTITDLSFLSSRPNKGLLIQGALEGEKSMEYTEHLKNVLKTKAKIELNKLLIDNSDNNYTKTENLKKYYHELKAYVAKENALFEAEKQDKINAGLLV